ncbi:MAG: AraC family transcriptional regulator [Cellulosilyticaceae bacterium]
MLQSVYENHTHKDPDFHIIFHYQTLTQTAYLNDVMHWHESIELIYVVEGACTVSCGLVPITAQSGEIIVINCNELHSFKPLTSSTSYYCLIIDKSIYDPIYIGLEEVAFTHLITAPTICQNYLHIIEEMTEQLPYYKVSVKAKITDLLINLLRYHIVEDNLSPSFNKSDPKIIMIKNAISYIRKNFTSNPPLEDICNAIGFSKYYFCRTFKEITNKTVTQYINQLKCQQAQKLLLSGNYTVTEVSELCGFNSLPYFCRIYKRYLGTSPSATK